MVSGQVQARAELRLGAVLVSKRDQTTLFKFLTPDIHTFGKLMEAMIVVARHRLWRLLPGCAHRALDVDQTCTYIFNILCMF